MKPISAQTWELLRELYEEKGFWDKFLDRHQPSLAMLNTIGGDFMYEEPLVIPHIASFLVHHSQLVREAAARAIGRLARRLSSSEWVQLDEACRVDWSYDSQFSFAWRRISPNQIPSLRNLPDSGTILGIASFHRDGHVRAAAVSGLAKIFDGTELPFLLLRLNDWVPTVRDAAAQAIQNRIRQDNARNFLRNLYLVFRLQSCSRHEHEPIIRGVGELLKQDEAFEALKEGIASHDSWLRRKCLHLAFESSSPELVGLLHHALTGPDSVLRLLATRNILPRLKEAELRKTLENLKSDSFMPVRCTALSMMVERFPSEAQTSLKAALFDTHSSVRHLARHFIKQQQPDLDFASVYRNECNAKVVARQRVAILGLGETGKPSDASILKDFLTHPTIGIRKATIHALAALDGDRFVDEFITALNDSSPGVSNEATAALLRRCIDYDLLLSLFRNETQRHVRKNLFKLLLRQSFWSRGVFLLELLRDPDSELKEIGKQQLSKWVASSGSMAIGPSKNELKLLQEALKSSSGMLSEHEIRYIEFSLKAYG